MNKFSFVDLNEFAFTEEPRSLCYNDYMEIRNNYVDLVSKLPGVKSIYQMGSITAPGISDIDLIIVLNDEVKDAKKIYYSTENLGETGRYIFMHPGAMIVNESTFINLPFLFHTANLHKIFGETTRQIKLTKKESEFVTYSIVIDASIHLIHKLLKFVISKRIPTRRALMNLTAVNYSIVLAEKVGLRGKAWSKYQKESKLLKTEWLLKRDRKKLIILLEEGIYIILEILFGIQKIFIEKRIIEKNCIASNSKNFFFTSHDSATVFTEFSDQFNKLWLDSIGKKIFMIRLNKIELSSILSIIYLPWIFYYHFKCYSNGSSWLSKSMKSIFNRGKVCATNSSIFDKQYESIMSKRTDLWCYNLTFLAKHRLLEFDVMPFFFNTQRYIMGNDLARIISVVTPFHLSLNINKIILKNLLTSMRDDLK